MVRQVVTFHQDFLQEETEDQKSSVFLLHKIS